ncbi:MAG: 2,3-bisphosphoglycerate-independent phosphoglycerate mutase [Gemmatimonadetes bacterium]|nr:2,3-bisphosphoglycerate-independent phosphoglycerate mutase [Gemmatimonadota bacterium]NIR81436.1 2,3-bisphosphoglycerate-independent phosphoglycerate mutase [Gemmatimonadota bacterium]NIT90275.1 2,3-bisphosphoglycerate-independent phosphoglycerate mutase [Gemmatimonadota bacterium]NIU34099.1 2,3-bisphosphoglycerate-independent phosphoglycerate mutase [Gemmatimonadota bacterium]NIU38256.1 2,3-bisphosphoglycerate-independent phosphoglycerate mutase [Gemmatimonadota bacterium]
MNEIVLPDAVVDRGGGGGRILLVVVDGLGGLPRPGTGRTELETARTPTMDALAARASLGMLEPVAPGITPGSGPGHLALFGYDPVRYSIGRGVLSALGVGFDLRHGDVAARLNLATLDGEGRVVDRRAGRPSDEEGRRIVQKVREALEPLEEVEVFVEHVKEHRALLVLRGEGLGAELADTDPQETGVPPDEVRAADEGSERTGRLVRAFLGRVREILADEPAANHLLARGFARYDGYPSVEERFGLRALAVAGYPMYRGVGRLVGMEVAAPRDDVEAVGTVEERFDEFDLTFLHFKAPDARGEDGDFDARVEAIEAVDGRLDRLVGLDPEVLVVTGDHSTPAAYRAHSWHAVPVLLASPWARPTAEEFGESACRGGDLGRIQGKHLISLALAHAGRLEKFGA